MVTTILIRAQLTTFITARRRESSVVSAPPMAKTGANFIRDTWKVAATQGSWFMIVSILATTTASKKTLSNFCLDAFTKKPTCFTPRKQMEYWEWARERVSR